MKAIETAEFDSSLFPSTPTAYGFSPSGSCHLFTLEITFQVKQFYL